MAVPRDQLRVAWIAGALTLIVTAGFTALRIDISALRDFERDAINLTAPHPAGAYPRYADPSPHSVWLPADLFVWEALRAGEVPLWNRLQGGGYSPVLAVQEGVFHPLRWLMAAVPRRSAPTVLILLAIATASTGMFLLMRFEFHASSAAGMLGAALFVCSPLFVSFTQFSGALLPIAHIPWLVFFYRRTASHSAALPLLAVAIAALIISGHPLLIASAALTVVLFAAAMVHEQRSLVPVMRASAAGGLALLIAAPAYLPALIARPSLWTYKTSTEQGHSYILYSIEGWVAALRGMVLDRYDPTSCCLDLDAYFIYVGIPVIVLSGLAVRRAVNDAGMRRQLILLAIAFLIAVPGPWMTVLQRFFSFFKPWYLMPAFTLLLSIAAATGFDEMRRHGRAGRLLAVALAVAGVGLYAWRSEHVFRPRQLPQETVSPALRFLREQGQHFRVVSLWGHNHIPNSSGLTGVEDQRLASPILPLRYHWWWQLVDRNVMRRSFPTTRVTDQLGSTLVGDFNILYLLQGRLPPRSTFVSNPDERRRDSMQWPYVESLPVAFQSPWLTIRALPAVRPRAHFVARAEVVPDLRAAVEALQANPQLAARAAVVESEERLALPVLARGEVEVRYPSFRSVALDVRSDTGGLVVLHDTVMEGWSAFIDGEPAELFAVNILSRGVVVPPGSHRVTMSFMPPGFTGALALSLAGVLCCVFWVVRSGRR